MKEKLIDVLKVQSESFGQFRMFAHIIRKLKKLGCSYYVNNGNIYATKGKTKNYPCIVSHMDTVHDIVSDLSVITANGNITGFNAHTMRQTGIGGDDKVGIFIALECLEHFSNIKAVFFRDEEVGCQGSYSPDLRFFDDVGFILQCDRRGYGDFITSAGGTKLCSKTFQKTIKPTLERYGYRFEYGMMTDVMALKESGVECSMANISCGYHNPHTDYEYVNINQVQMCLEMVKELITLLKGNRYAFPYKAKTYTSYPTVAGNAYTSLPNQVDDDYEAQVKAQYGYKGDYKTYDGYTYKAKNKYKGKSATYRQGEWEWDDEPKKIGDVRYDGFHAPEDKKFLTKGEILYDCEGCLEPTPANEISYETDYNMNLCTNCVKAWDTQIHGGFSEIEANIKAKNEAADDTPDWPII